MITNGENTNYIKDIVKIVKKLFVGQAEKKPKVTEMLCSIKTVKHVCVNWLNSKSNTTFKTTLLLFFALIVSRLLPLPPNSEPLLGLAVLTPYLSKNSLAFLFPLSVMFVSDIFLGFHGSMIMTYSALALAPFISKFIANKYASLFSSWIVWHIMANIGQLYPPFSPEALLFDVRFLLSGLSIVILFDLVQKFISTNLSYNK